MKSCNGIYIPPYDNDDIHVPVYKYGASFSHRTISQMARGNTVEAFMRQCHQGLTTVDDDGSELSGKDLFDAYKHMCRDFQN